MLRKIKDWYNKMYRDVYTVVCDTAPFWTPTNTEEKLFYCIGLAEARKFAKTWITTYSMGQARIIKGKVGHERNN